MARLVGIVIPCYNEEQVLPELFRRLTPAADQWPYDWTVVCVDDGSRDDTLELLRRQCSADPRWMVLSLSRNFGHQAAITAGLEHVPGDVVIVMDADLQDPPEELFRLLAEWAAGYDVVYAIRKNRKEGLVKRTAYWVFYRFLASLVPFSIPLDSGDFCVMDRKVVDVLNELPEKSRFVRGLRAWSGFRQIGVPYERKDRAAGEPKYTFRKLLKLAKDGVFSFSGIPLRVASHLGLWISVISLVGAGFTVVQRLFKGYFASIGLGPVPGYATTVISILFLGGVQLVALGIIGEYLERIFEEVKRRPVYIVREAIGLDHARHTPQAVAGRSVELKQS